MKIKLEYDEKNKPKIVEFEGTEKELDNLEKRIYLTKDQKIKDKMFNAFK